MVTVFAPETLPAAGVTAEMVVLVSGVALVMALVTGEGSPAHPTRTRAVAAAMPIPAMSRRGADDCEEWRMRPS
ncbi:hypothetical protein GCM10017584_16740 [Leifsonia poae]|uniref:Uncharacterized protein n=1 Tax=Leifsonia poae TaxID=110933 RepID=A0A9W6H8X8_9MICO|nr:hypothetical protein GCM10017584_16740 [Leifsonia poae]